MDRKNYAGKQTPDLETTDLLSAPNVDTEKTAERKRQLLGSPEGRSPLALSAQDPPAVYVDNQKDLRRLNILWHRFIIEETNDKGVAYENKTILHRR